MPMNQFQAIWQLSELADHVRGIITEIETGRFDDDGDLSYAVALAHVMDHLSLAWHYSRMSDDRINGLSQPEFEQLANSVPKLGINQKLVEPYDTVV
jgi:hypothetical protein